MDKEELKSFFSAFVDFADAPQAEQKKKVRDLLHKLYDYGGESSNQGVSLARLVPMYYIVLLANEGLSEKRVRQITEEANDFINSFETPRERAVREFVENNT